jgi:hypothetical protein
VPASEGFMTALSKVEGPIPSHGQHGQQRHDAIVGAELARHDTSGNKKAPRDTGQAKPLFKARRHPQVIKIVRDIATKKVKRPSALRLDATESCCRGKGGRGRRHKERVHVTGI